MPLPDTGPTSLEAVKAHLGITDTRDDSALTSVVDAVNVVVRRLPVTARLERAGAVEWPDDIIEGSTMLAGRLWRRRDSPAGVVVFGDAGAVYVQRNDPDVAMLLQLGAWAHPAVG